MTGVQSVLFRSQFQNGVAERRIGLLNKSTKAMLYASGLPMADWYHAMEYAAYLLNRTFSNSFPSPDGYLSPYQVFYQGAPDYVPCWSMSLGEANSNTNYFSF